MIIIDDRWQLIILFGNNYQKKNINSHFSIVVELPTNETTSQSKAFLSLSLSLSLSVIKDNDLFVRFESHEE